MSNGTDLSLKKETSKYRYLQKSSTSREYWKRNKDNTIIVEYHDDYNSAEKAMLRDLHWAYEYDCGKTCLSTWEDILNRDWSNDRYTGQLFIHGDNIIIKCLNCTRQFIVEEIDEEKDKQKLEEANKGKGR